MTENSTREELEQRISELENEQVRSKEVKTALEESERRYRLIAENTNDVIWTMDPDTMKFTFVSPSIVKLTGHPPEKYLNNPLEDVVPPHLLKPMLDVLREAQDSAGSNGTDEDTTRRFEWQEYHKDGHLIWLEVDAKFIRNSSGEIVSVIGVTRNISDRKNRKAHISERNVFIETILANLPIGLAVNKISDGTAIYMNDKFEEIYGWPKDRLVDIDSFFRCVYPDKNFREEIKARIMADLDSGDISRMRWENITVTDINGDKKSVSATNIPIADQDLMISTVQDVTARNQLETQLYHAQKMKSMGTLTGGIAHDFNNILSIMIGNTELALDVIPEGNPAHVNLKNIKTAGLRAADIVKQLLNFSRTTEAGHRAVKIVSIIKESLKLLRAIVPSTIEIRQDIPEDTGTILADPTQIHQIMINLCTNASESMEEGGLLDISIENVYLDDRYVLVDPDLKSGNYVKLSVSDNGCGINQEDMTRIFDPYFTTKDVGKGSGMGLSVVHGIVKSHNGSIVVNSEPGKGTTIIIYIPSTDMELEMNVQDEQTLPTGKERILFVDDEPFITEVAQQMLEKLGYKVYTKVDPLDALDFFTANPHHFDLAILDMTMPHMTGDKLAEEILKHNPDVPVIICSGHSERLDIGKSKEIGVKAFLMKPLLKLDLANTVRRVLDQL